MAPARRVRSFVVKHRSAPGAAIHLLHLLDVRPRELDVAQAEVERYRGLEHPSLPKLVDVFTYKRQVAVVMERDDGVRLDKLKGYLDRDRERLPDAAVWFVGWRICSALAQAHLARNRAGDLAPILHGSLSLRDVLVGWDGDVTIHGLCPVLSDVPVAEDDTPGPPSRAWLAPSVRKGEPLTPRVDTYAGALVLRCLLTGRPPPTPGASSATMKELRDDIPEDVARSLDRALRGRARPSSAELAQRLEGLVRITDGRQALRDCMELYQALWGLWSVAAPEQWSSEGKAKLEVTPVESFQPTSVIPSEAVPLSELETMDGDTPPDTSRSPGATSKVPRTRDDAIEDVVVASAVASTELAAEEQEPAASVDPGPLTSTMVSPPDDIAEAQRHAAQAQRAHEAREEARSPPPMPSDPDPAGASEEQLEDDSDRVSGFRSTANGGLGATLTSAPSRKPAPSKTEPRASPEPAPRVVSPSASVPPEEQRSKWPLYAVAGVIVALMAWYASRDRRADGERLPSKPAPSASAAEPLRPPPTPPEPTTAPDPEPAVRPAASVPEPDPSNMVTVEPTLTSAERAVMEYTQGYLLVRSELPDAKVFVNGHPVGPVGRKNKIFCGPKFVRLGRGNPPTTPWLTKGMTVDLACRDLTVVSIPSERTK
jgi:Protein tyrosine and serine/threonine kinase